MEGPTEDRPAQIIPPLDALKQAYDNPGREQRALARPLGFALLDAMKKSGRYRNMDQLGREMIDAMWPPHGPLPTGSDPMKSIMAKLDAITDPNDRRACSEMLAKLGHVHQLAGLLQRERILSQTTTPPTADSFLTGKIGNNTIPAFTNVNNAVEALNRPKLELTFTAHPTNTNGFSGMVAQRQLVKALADWSKGPNGKQEVAAALRNYANAPLLPELKNGSPGLTVRDETKYMLYFLGNLYQDLDQVYAGYDRALTKRFKDFYQPTTLRLNLDFHSWGSSGDKDGNKNVNADTTLYGVASHYKYAATNFDEELKKIPGLDNWKQAINRVRKETGDITAAMEREMDGKGHLSEASYDRYAARLKEAVAPLDKKKFLADIEAAYKTAPQPELLALLRHVHTFGFAFGHIEYRETAEEFERIACKLVPEYAEAMAPLAALEQQVAQKKKERGTLAEGDAARSATLTTEINKLEEQFGTLHASIEKQRRDILGAVLKDPERLGALAGALSELGKGQDGKPYSDSDVGPIAYHTKKRLELARDFPDAVQNQVLAECQDASNLLEMLLLQHAVAKDGKRPVMGIVPLFEDSDTLEKSPAILKAALADPAYREHLDTVAAARGVPAAQQVQLAHSDNARRNGMPAARALIYRTHEQLRSAITEHNHKAGGKPVTLEFYEGGSLCDPYRGGGRAVSASINEYQSWGQYKTTAQGGDLLTLFNNPHAVYRFFNRNITHNAAKLIKGPEKDRNGADRQVTDALIETKEGYKELFHGEEINRFLESIDFAAEARAGNVSSRATSRVGASDRVDVTNVRTISFAEGQQHAGLTPTWVGTLPLPSLFKKHGLKMNVKDLKGYYDKSPLFRDEADRFLWGLAPARTDLAYLRDRSGGHPLMERFEKEEGVAYGIALGAYTGKTPAELKKIGRVKFGRDYDLNTAEGKRQMLVDMVYPHVADVFEDQEHFTSLIRHMKEHWKPAQDDSASTLPYLWHNALDTHLHGYEPRISDPTYASLFCDKYKIERPFAPESFLGSSRA